MVKVKRQRVKGLKKHMSMLELYGKATPEQAGQMNKWMPDDLIDQICSCIYNALNIIPWDKDQLQNLSKKISKDKLNLRYLSTASCGKKRRRVLTQSGGSVLDVLLSVLPIALAFL